MPAVRSGFADFQPPMMSWVLVLQAHEEDVMALVKSRLLLPVCDAIETQLRLHHHQTKVFGPHFNYYSSKNVHLTFPVP
jgi:hypothetical protein